MSTDRLEERVARLVGQPARRGELIQSLWSGYGEIVRCHLDDGSAVIAKHVAPGQGSHPRGWNSDLGHQRKLRSYAHEACWYREWAGRCDEGCRVPACLDIEQDDDGWLFVLEDLDAAGFPDRRQRLEEPDLAACLSWLAEFHALFLGDQPEGLWPVGTYWHLETRPEELAAVQDEALRVAAPRIDALLSSATHRTLVHGDAKVANFCFRADGLPAVAAVDFQYVGGGVGVKDLTYFLGSCLGEDECEAREEELLGRYFDMLSEALHRRGHGSIASDVEAEWRELFPVAWTDFHRFLVGWAPGHWKLNGYSCRLAREVVAALD